VPATTLTEAKLKLDIGAGGVKTPGYKTVDADPSVEPDILCNVLDGIPVSDDSCTHLRLSHVLEHFTPADGLKLLRELHRILAPGGTLFVEVPDLLEVARRIVDQNGLDIIPPPGLSLALYPHGVIYGSQENEYQFHKTGYTPPYLRQTMERSGFIVDTITTVFPENMHVLRCTATKAGSVRQVPVEADGG